MKLSFKVCIMTCNNLFGNDILTNHNSLQVQIIILHKIKIYQFYLTLFEIKQYYIYLFLSQFLKYFAVQYKPDIIFLSKTKPRLRSYPKLGDN